jgi:hypothetical protein
VCARIGRGGDDLAILSRFGQYLDMEDAEGLDAWLRLHERGFRFPEDREYPDVLEYLGHCDIIRVTAGRPDLLKRAKAVADELRLGWPPRAPLRFSRDRAH